MAFLFYTLTFFFLIGATGQLFDPVNEPCPIFR